VNPVVLSKTGSEPRLAFVTYYKGDYSVHTFDLKEPMKTVASADFGAPGPIVDFQAPIQHTVVAENKTKKGRFDKMFLDGRPPVNVGVTSGGDIFGGSQVSFSDVLGDQQFSLYASSVQQYKTMAFSYLNLSRRFQWALQGYSQTQFFYGQLGNYLYDPAIAPYISRSDALATQTIRGGEIFGIYPFSHYRRVEISGGYLQYNEQYNDPYLQQAAQQYQLQQFGTTQLFRNGSSMPLGLSFVQETTVFREYGPLSGSTMRLAYDTSPKIGKTLSNQTGDLDARKYIRLGANGVFAVRARVFKSWGAAPNYTYFGGNSEMRGYDYREFIGQKAFYSNAELRFPLVNAMATPLGVVGGIRGVFYFNLGGAALNDQCSYASTSNTGPGCLGFKLYDRGTQTISIQTSPTSKKNYTFNGFRLIDSRASYGIGLETFALGFPVHFDWSYRTLFNKGWEDYLFSSAGGSAAWRKVRFAAWIGYDF